jgi:hypothetical protein
VGPAFESRSGRSSFTILGSRTAVSCPPRAPMASQPCAAWTWQAQQEVVIRKHLQLLDGVPAVISTSYYPMWVAEGTRLESADALPEGPDTSSSSWNCFARGMELLQARMPTPDEVRTLELGPVCQWLRMTRMPLTGMSLHSSGPSRTGLDKWVSGRAIGPS